MALQDSVSLASFVFTAASGLIGGMVVLGGFLVKFGRRWQKFESLEDNHRRLESRFDTLESKFDSLRDSFTNVKAGLVQSGILKESFLTHGSPVSLTDSGKKALEESGFVRLFSDEQVKRDLFAAVEQAKPKNAYDVQVAAADAVRSFTDDPRFAGLKLYMFRKGEPLDELVSAAGIFLRDAYLDAHQEVPR